MCRRPYHKQSGRCNIEYRPSRIAKCQVLQCQGEVSKWWRILASFGMKRLLRDLFFMKQRDAMLVQLATRQVIMQKLRRMPRDHTEKLAK